ncbi:Olfactory Receptor 7G3 [Manis pentadactyla]|nr:Olfactory Receptor 7G3 [Manis pentadactyla]
MNVFSTTQGYNDNKYNRYFTYMEILNLTGVSEFLLLGLSGDPELQPLLFGLFLSMYLVTVLGNLLIILAVGPHPHLHTPMYFFLSCLSLADTGFSTTTIPKMLVNIQTQRKSISYAGCLTQVFFFSLFGCLDSLILAVMAYDRFVAICHPLHYPAIMRPQLCGLLVLLSFLISLLDSQTHCLMVSKLGFCTDVEIPHFFCDIPKLLSLACSDTSIKLQPLLFGLFLSMYLITVLGNLLIILDVGSDHHLHTPMYFLLSSLSLADIGFTSTTVPKMLVNIQTHRKSISYSGCLTQMCFVMVFGGMDTFLLTVMSYDWFVAICHPLHYTVIMSAHLCGLLVLVSWLISLSYSLMQSLLMSRLSFCSRRVIPHFYCALTQALMLACSGTLINHILLHMVTAFLVIVPFSGTLFSYTRIASSILKIPSASGKCKAFSTCASHLSVVSLFYGAGLGVYLSSNAYSQKGMIGSVVYTVVTPMLNPFIYSLWNKDMKGNCKKLLGENSMITEKKAGCGVLI